jgi:hypothetical protein
MRVRQPSVLQNTSDAEMNSAPSGSSLARITASRPSHGVAFVERNGIRRRWSMKYCSTSEGSPRRHAGTDPRTTTRAVVCFFRARTVSATLSRCSPQVPCSSTISGSSRRASDTTLSLMARQLGARAAAPKSGFQGQETPSESRFCRAFESAFGRLEKQAKNLIYSIAC